MKFTKLWPMVVVLGVVACQTDPFEGAPGPMTFDAAWRPIPGEEDCPKNWGEWSDRGIDLSLVNQRVDSVPLSGPGETQNTPEFHDCQRFVLRGRPGGPDTLSTGVYAIFAAIKPTKKEDQLPNRSSDYSRDGTNGYARAAAQIFATEPYEPLGLEPGLNCLYIYRTRDGYWGGGVRQDYDRDRICADSIPILAALRYQSLPVVQEIEPSLPADAYPTAVRWKVHQTRTGDYEYRMGVSCDWGWCEVRPRDSDNQHSPSLARGVVYDPLDLGLRRVHRIKGWYDEQVLTEVGPNGLRPSGILGTVIPVPRLHDYVEADFTVGFKPTAWVALTPFSQGLTGNPYERKLNLGFTDQTGGVLNQIELCNNTWDACIGESGPPAGFPLLDPTAPERAPTCSPDNPLDWWARITAPNGRVDYRCVAECPYEFHVPGTARWRWLGDDEGIWMRCVNGCCEIGPGVEDQQ